MIRYKIDELGWYQFEQLIQSVLKAQFGFAIESWGGRGDWGVDAYFEGSLKYPDREIHEGLFIFQMKFVENANSSGAKPEQALLKAVKSEIYKLKNHPDYSWLEKVDHYVLVTNAPVSPAFRDEIKIAFNKLFSGVQVHCHGGIDVCDWLDNNPQIRRSFPQLLSLRELDSILNETVNRHILTRSLSAIEEAKEIVPIFMPTEAYRKVWDTLKKHKFVVIDGPPEVGKTAIALIIALVQVLDKWEAIYCKGPEDVLQIYKPKTKQLFITDDAFGRTEYDPERGKLWERELHHLLRGLDNNHWLILTSRKHILERAYKDMDLQDKAKDFPKPGEVVVDATELSMKEKALILYRHAKAENLLDSAKEIVRRHAKSIIYNPNFTPERIRRFVKEELPDINKKRSERCLNKKILANKISNAINNPTDRMIKTHDSLPLSHKWLLASFLAIDESSMWRFNGFKKLKEIYEQYRSHSPEENLLGFNDVVDELTEAFIKKISIGDKVIVEWIHPSYRDLVIEKVSNDTKMSKRLLEFGSIDIIKLAISDTGGQEGERRLPLLTSNEQWEIFRERCLELVDEITNDDSIISLLVTLRSSYLNSSEKSTERDKISQISKEILERLNNKWNANEKELTPQILDAYFRLSLIVTPLPSSPNVKCSWDSTFKKFKKGIKLSKNSAFDIDLFSPWIELLYIIKNNEPRFLKQVSFTEQYREIIKGFIELTKNELNFEGMNDSVEEVRAFAEKFSKTAEILETLSLVTEWNVFSEIEQLSKEFEMKVKELEEKAIELEPPEEDPEESNPEDFKEDFDIDKLFSDL